MSDTPRTLPVIQPGAEANASPVFDKIAILGLGLIGGSVALAARKIWPRGLVIGVDEKSVLEQAMVRHAIDVAAEDPVVIAEADLIILAAPVRDNIALLDDLGQHVTGSAVVTDVGGTKREIVNASRRLPERLVFVGGHPLGGAPRGGIRHARPDLFEGRPWLFTPTEGSQPAALPRLRQFVAALGAVPYVLSPGAHDRLIAFLSHLPQLTASALMHVVGAEVGEDGLALSGRGLSDTTRLASSPAAIWRDICATNADEVSAALGALIAQLQVLRGDLESGDGLVRIFRSAAAWRGVLATHQHHTRSE